MEINNLMKILKASTDKIVHLENKLNRMNDRVTVLEASNTSYVYRLDSENKIR